jgi:hypothetical protein
MTSTTRAALERLIETWRVEAERGRFPTSVGVPRLDYTERAYAHVECADELAALLTAEGLAPEPTIHCTVVELNGKTLAAPCAIEERCMYPGPPSREALAARLTDDVLEAADYAVSTGSTSEMYDRMRTVLLDALCPQEPT